MNFGKVQVDIHKWIGLLIILTFFVKLLMSTLNIPDAIGLLVVASVSLAAKVVDYKYPKRPDFYSDLELLKSKVDELEHDMTGVKFGLKTRN